MPEPEVRAAGGLLWRRNDDGELEVVLVHRPRYDDWSFPKGKAERGESDEDAAVREVEEETTVRARRGAELPPSYYHDAKGRWKIVRYWAMEHVGGDPAPCNEVDEVRWLSLAEATALLTYDRDRALLGALEEALA